MIKLLLSLMVLISKKNILRIILISDICDFGDGRGVYHTD